MTEVTDIREGEAPAPPRRVQSSYAGLPDSCDAQEARGTVKWYNAQKGFGFVAPDGGGKDIFVHATALQRGGIAGLAEGQIVRMQVIQGKKGPEASSVSVD